MRCWAALLLFAAWAALVRAAPFPFQLPRSRTLVQGPQWPAFNGVGAVVGDDQDVYAVTTPAQGYVFPEHACHQTSTANYYASNNLRAEVLRMNASRLKRLTENATTIRFFPQPGCRGKEAVVPFGGPLCHSFPGSGGVYFFWKSVLVPPRSTVALRRSSACQNQCAEAVCEYDETVWTFENKNGSAPKCYDRPASHHYAFYASMVSEANPFMERMVFSNAPFYDTVLKQSAVQTPGSHYVRKAILARDALLLLFTNQFGCNNRPSQIVRVDRGLNAAAATVVAELPHPVTGQTVGYANAPTGFFAYRGHVFVAFSHPSFSGVHAYDVGGNVSAAGAVYFETVATNGEGITTTSYYSDTSNALLVRGSEAWLFDVEYIVVVNLEGAFFAANALPNASYELVSFDHGQVHTVAYDPRNGRVYAMLGARLFAIDAATREVLAHDERCGTTAVEYDGSWGLRGPLVVDATRGLGFLFPSGSHQTVRLRDFRLVRGDGTYTDDRFRDAWRRGGYVDTSHINHANVSGLLPGGWLVSGTHANNYDFQPPLLLVSPPQGCAAGRAGAGCRTCVVGQFSGAGWDDCIPCSPGRFARDNESISCDSCPVGRHGGGEACEPCPFGTFADTAGQARCTPCPSGRYHMQRQSQTPGDCLACPPGKITEAEGASACVDCPLGRYKSGPRCAPCPVGTLRDAGTAECRACPLGRYGSPRNASREEDCAECPAGRYGNKDRLSTITVLDACEACPAGRMSDTGAVIDECVPCAAGRTSKGAACEACPPGAFAKADGMVACEPCVDGVTNDEGSVRCNACPSNSEAAPNRRQCVCSAGFYGECDGSTCECNECPWGAECPKPGTTLRTLSLQKGFWRLTEASLDIRRCNEFYACEGGGANDTGCRAGHHGPLCHICDPGFAKTGGLCAPCPSDRKAFNVFVTASAPFALAVVLILLIRSANPPEGAQDVFSGVTKIAASYAQVYSLCSNFDVKWPPLLVALFDASDYVNPSISFYSADCTIPWTFYDRLWVYVAMPPLYLALVVLVLLAASACRGERLRFFHKWFWTSTVVGLFLAYPSVVKILMRVLSCDQVGEHYYLSTDYSVACYDDAHVTATIISAAALVVYGAGIPLTAFFVLFHYKYRLQHRQVSRSLRFLFSGYRLYYWEFVVMARKVCIVAMSVFLFRQGSIRYQAIAASWLLQVCMFLHLKLQPFDHNSHYGRVCNRLEWLGLVSTTLTMNTGIVFGTTQDDYPLGLLENVLLVTVVGINAVIFVVFAYYIVSSGTKKMAKEVYEKLYERCRKRPLPPDTVARRKKTLFQSRRELFEERVHLLYQNESAPLEEKLLEMRTFFKPELGGVLESLEYTRNVLDTLRREQKFAHKKYVDAVDRLSQDVCRNLHRPGVLSACELFLRENDLHEAWRRDEARDTLGPIRGLVVTLQVRRWMDGFLDRHFGPALSTTPCLRATV